MFAHFHQLWEDLPRIREKVDLLESTEVDSKVKIAMVGYSYHCPIDLWGQEEFEFVAQRRHEVADFDPRWVEFVCLASGYLLGLFQSRNFNDAECAQFETQLPGFMWQYSERFQG